MAAPIIIVAIDAGSNAIRAVVARAGSATNIRELDAERRPIRLGHRVFTHQRLHPRILAHAVETFRHFRSLLRRYDVREYRAVATSAVREACNRESLIRRIYRETEIRLEVIDPAEESRLVRSAVLGVLEEKATPRIIVDLGGGSLEISLLRGRNVERVLALPVGTVRLMEMFGIQGAFTESALDSLRHHVLSRLQCVLPDRPDLSRVIGAACGGNAEALARLAPGPRTAGIDVLNLRLLQERLWEILRLDVAERMRLFAVRKDRAEVMGVAAVVFTTLAEWLRLKSLLVPGVGVREGILRDLALEHFSAAGRRDQKAEALIEQTRQFANRLHCEQRHAENVRRLAASLYDQLAPIHGLPAELRLPLELAALLHDIGLVISTKSHHKHGEYLIRHAQIPGLPEEHQNLMACLVRYHSKAGPEPHHKLYSSLSPRNRRRVRALSAILRIAVGLDAEGSGTAQEVEVTIRGKHVRFRIHADSASGVTLWTARRKSKLFEKEFGLKTHFSRIRKRIAFTISPESLLISPADRPLAEIVTISAA